MYRGFNGRCGFHGGVTLSENIATDVLALYTDEKDIPAESKIANFLIENNLYDIDLMESFEGDDEDNQPVDQLFNFLPCKSTLHLWR